MSYLKGPICKDPEVLEFMLDQEQPYWTIIEFKGKRYIMTFELNVYEVI